MWVTPCCAQIFLKPVKRTSTSWTQALLPTFQVPQTVLADQNTTRPLPFLRATRPQVSGYPLCGHVLRGRRAPAAARKRITIGLHQSGQCHSLLHDSFRRGNRMHSGCWKRKGGLMHDFCSKCPSQARDAQVKSDTLLLEDMITSECDAWNNGSIL